MRIILVFLLVILSGCSSVKKYEEIVEGALEDYKSDNITYHFSSWVPFDAPDNTSLSDEENRSSARDQELCVDDYRGVNFEDEAFSIVYFMQCMNKKGWRLHTEEVIVISH